MTGCFSKKWATSTPHNFRFTVKLPRHIIEDAYKVGDFLEELAPLLTLGHGGREWLDIS
jgi:uncharacterized protein YecE (DUF72 family)